MYKMKLLANLPIYVDKIPIYSPTLKRIAELDKEQYSACLSSCIITKDSLTEKNELDQDNFDVLIRLCIQHGLISNFLFSLFYFTKLEFNIQEKDNDIVFCSGEMELNRYNYNSFIKSVKYVNCLESYEEAELDEFDKRCLEMERKIQEQQSYGKDKPELEDLISAVANMDGNGLNIMNIWDLNIYQFYEQLQRGQLKEQYYLAIKQLLAGAKPEEVKIESYFKTIK